MIDHAQERDRRDHQDDAEIIERRPRETADVEDRRDHPERAVPPSRQTISLDALVAERRPFWYASHADARPESPAARRFLRRVNAALIVVPLACLAALGIYESGLHVMVIWPDGGRPKLHYFWMSNGQEIPSPVARTAESIGAKTP